MDPPFADVATRKQGSFADELTCINTLFELFILVSERIGRNQWLKVRRINLVDKGNLLIFEMNGQHIVIDVKTRWTITWKFDHQPLSL